MTEGTWRPLDFDQETAWLGGAESGGAITGFDPVSWESSIWIAHAMYELPGMDVDYTHDDAHRARIAAGVEEPLIIGSVNLDEVSTVTGGQFGLVGRPSQEWVRVRWSELSVRLGTIMDDQEFPPCFKWFPYKSWPASMEPPPEGSLDDLSLRGLIPHLVAAGPSDECVAAEVADRPANR